MIRNTGQRCRAKPASVHFFLEQCLALVVFLGPSGVVSAAYPQVLPGGSRSALRVVPVSGPFWLGAAASLAGAVTLDRPIRQRMAAEHTPALDRLAAAVGPLGTARVLVPAMSGAYLLARLGHTRAGARATLHVAGGYATADVVAALLKPTVGRARPHTTGGPWDFHPFTLSGDWHSFPSGHAVHIAALVAATARETHRPWVATVGYGLATLVDAQRVYTDQHWTSDVVTGSVLGVAASATAVRWLDERGRGAKR